MSKESFAGITPDTIEKLTDTWETKLDYVGQFFAETKDTFEYDDEDLHFKYKFVIEAYNMREYGEKGVAYTIALVPTYHSLSEKHKENFEGCTDIMDIYDYGINILMAHELHETDEEINKNTLDCMATITSLINRMLGFYMDRALNRIGTTGWILIDDYVNGKDFIQETFKKYNEES